MLRLRNGLLDPLSPYLSRFIKTPFRNNVLSQLVVDSGEGPQVEIKVSVEPEIVTLVQQTLDNQTTASRQNVASVVEARHFDSNPTLFVLRRRVGGI